MRVSFCSGMIAAVVLTTGTAGAHPDGAPWGAAKPSASESCATCHFDSEPIHDSPLLQLDGLPEKVISGKTYNLTVSLKDPNAVVAGFQLIAQAGEFTSAAAHVEFIGAAIRSTKPVADDGAVSWALQWRAPFENASSISFFLAASAANDDQSPLGDQIHFHFYELSTNISQPK